MSQQPMIRPGQIDSIPNLDPAIREKYKVGLAGLWHTHDTAPPGSQQQIEAGVKIRNASATIMQNMARPPQQQQRPGSGGQQRLNAPQPGPVNAGQMGQAQGQGQGPTQGQARPQPGQPGASQGQMSLSEKSQQELDQLHIPHPPDMAPQQLVAWKETVRSQMRNSLLRRDMAFAAGRQASTQINTLTRGGQPVPDQLTQQLAKAKLDVNEAEAKLQQVKSHVQRRAVTGGQDQRPITQQGMNGQQQQQQQPHAQQSQDGKPTAPYQQGNSTSPAHQQGGFQQQSQIAQPTAAQGAHQHLPQQHPAGQPQNNTPQAAPPNQNFPPHNAQQNANPQQARPPPVNTQQAPNQAGQQAPQPGSATQAPQRPQPLTHQAAVNQARDFHQQRQSQNPGQNPNQPHQPLQQQTPNGTGAGMPFTSHPTPATQQSTPTSAYPTHPPGQPQPGPNVRNFPIPKTLTVDPRTQQPVPGPPARPTLAHQGMLHAPGTARAPPYTLEGEGDRVLSKRKLDELVRQVTGAAPVADGGEGGGDSAAILSPEVEESLMAVADDFVDDLITAACRLAKLRPNAQLDLRDIQMVLERNYGIRIPGYSLDEVRTVRKFQPAPGWQSKMQAVQAGKVMGNREA